MMPLLNAIRLTLSANMQTTPSASYSLTLRVKLSSRAGTLGQVATAIGRAGGDIGAIDIASERDFSHWIRLYGACPGHVRM